MKTKGLAFIGLFHFVENEFGKSAVVDTVEGLVKDPEGFLASVEPGAWYPSELFGNIFEFVVWELGEGDMALARDIGRHICYHHHRSHPEDFLPVDIADQREMETRLNRFWREYHSEGQLLFAAKGKGFWLRVDCPELLTRAYMEKVSGWIEALLDIWGVRGYDVLVGEDQAELEIIKPKMTDNENALNSSL